MVINLTQQLGLIWLITLGLHVNWDLEACKSSRYVCGLKMKMKMKSDKHDDS